MALTAMQRAAQSIDKQLVEPLRQRALARMFFKQTSIPEGKFEVVYNTITDMGDGIISYNLPTSDELRDIIKVTETNLQLAILKKGYEIPRAQYQAFKSSGMPFDTAAAMSAAQQVLELEEALYLQGWAPDGSTYEINGAYQSAGNDYSTSADFATAGKPTTAVAGAFALLAADNVTNQNYNLVLNPTQYSQLLALRNTNGVREMPEVLELLNPNAAMAKGGIYQSTNITAGTGLMLPVDPSGMYMDVVVAAGMRNVLGEDSKIPDISPIYGTTYEVVVPRFKQTDALCVLSSI